MFTVLAQAINVFSEVLVWVVIIDSLLSYFLPPYHPVRSALDRLVEPLLAPLRRVVPLVGMIDFTPLVFIILVQLISGFLVNLLLMMR